MLPSTEILGWNWFFYPVVFFLLYFRHVSKADSLLFDSRSTRKNVQLYALKVLIAAVLLLYFKQQRDEWKSPLLIFCCSPKEKKKRISFFKCHPPEALTWWSMIPSTFRINIKTKKHPLVTASNVSLSQFRLDLQDCFVGIALSWTARCEVTHQLASFAGSGTRFLTILMTWRMVTGKVKCVIRPVLARRCRMMSQTATRLWKTQLPWTNRQKCLFALYYVCD